VEHTVEIYADDELRLRYEAVSPPILQVGDHVIVERRAHVITSVEHELSATAQLTRVRTSHGARAQTLPQDGAVASFLRYHVLIRVFDGDITAWLRIARDAEDVAFLRALERRVRGNPDLLESIRTTVDSSGLSPRTERGERRVIALLKRNGPESRQGST
jgi:hypothetical protein